VGIESTISAGERPQTYALERATIGTGRAEEYRTKNIQISLYPTKHKIVVPAGRWIGSHYSPPEQVLYSVRSRWSYCLHLGLYDPG